MLYLKMVLKMVHFLVGNKLSIADIGLLEVLLTIDELLGVESLSEFVELKKFYENMKSILISC
jgi:glutathione S-transferase